MAAGLRFGLKRAMWNIMGLITGIMVVLAVVATGLGALLAASTIAFTDHQVARRGLPRLSRDHAVARAAASRSIRRRMRARSAARAGQLYVRGFLVNATNPKGIVFMLAVLPQFIDPAQPQAIQYAICGATLMSTDLIVMTGYTAFAAKALRLMKKPSQMKAMNRTFGGLLMGMSALLATFKRAA